LLVATGAGGVDFVVVHFALIIIAPNKNPPTATSNRNGIDHNSGLNPL